MKGSSFPFYPMSYRTLVRLCSASGDLSALCGDHYLERCDESVEVGRFGTESLAAHNFLGFRAFGSSSSAAAVMASATRRRDPQRAVADDLHVYGQQLKDSDLLLGRYPANRSCATSASSHRRNRLATTPSATPSVTSTKVA